MEKLHELLAAQGAVMIDDPDVIKASHALCSTLQELLSPKDYDVVMLIFSAVLAAAYRKQEGQHE